MHKCCAPTLLNNINTILQIPLSSWTAIAIIFIVSVHWLVVLASANNDAVNGIKNTHLTEADFQLGQWIVKQHWYQKQNVSLSRIFRPGRFQGDIVGFLNQVKASAAAVDRFPLKPPGNIRYAATKQLSRLWPSGIIPYTISPMYGSFARAQIAAAMNEFHTKTCIRFVPRNAERDFLNIFAGDGCYSGFGRQGGQQDSSLDNDCIRALGIVIHELMHNIGFLHEHSRPDRDHYVTVLWNNILPEYVDDFQRHDDTDTLSLPYDYQSIMHYGSKDFSVNGQPTIVPTRPGAVIGQEYGLSSVDVQKINKLYNCHVLGPFNAAITGPQRLPAKEICSDKRDDCGYLKSLQYCTVYPVWVSEQCPKTCNLCYEDPTVFPLNDNSVTLSQPQLCFDGNSHCEMWAASGYCSTGSHVPYMSQHCRKSCRLC